MSPELDVAWNDHHSTIVGIFEKLLDNCSLVDCTIAAEGQYVKAHKLVLSACSPYFEMLFKQENEKNPIVILKDTKFQELKAIIDFVYRGKVKISKDRLQCFIDAAESLQIKGLEGDPKKNDLRKRVNEFMQDTEGPVSSIPDKRRRTRRRRSSSSCSSAGGQNTGGFSPGTETLEDESNCENVTHNPTTENIPQFANPVPPPFSGNGEPQTVLLETGEQEELCSAQTNPTCSVVEPTERVVKTESDHEHEFLETEALFLVEPKLEVCEEVPEFARADIVGEDSNVDGIGEEGHADVMGEVGNVTVVQEKSTNQSNGGTEEKSALSEDRMLFIESLSPLSPGCHDVLASGSSTFTNAGNDDAKAGGGDAEEYPPGPSLRFRTFSSTSDDTSCTMTNTVGPTASSCGVNFASDDRDEEPVFLGIVRVYGEKQVASARSSSFAMSDTADTNDNGSAVDRSASIDAGNTVGYHNDRSAIDERSETPKNSCHLCGKCYTTKLHLKEHVQTHLRPFVCDDFCLCRICGKRFPDTVSWETHVRSHNLAFLCEYCGKSFQRKRHLEEHESTRTGKRWLKHGRHDTVH